MTRSNVNLSLYQRVLTILKEQPGKKMKAIEIARIMKEKFPEALERKKRTTSKKSDDEVVNQWNSEISSKFLAKNNSEVLITNESPRRYYYPADEQTTKPTWTDRIATILTNNTDKRFQAKEIAELLTKHFPKECDEKLAKSPKQKNKADLIRQLTSEVPRHFETLEQKHGVKKTNEKPTRYYLPSQQDEQNQPTITKTKQEPKVISKKISEFDLYPLLGRYVRDQFNVYSMRIEESTSSNTHGKGGNHWLHPDCVGAEDLTEGLDENVKNVIKQSNLRFRLWSFEVKKSVDRPNVRSVFFQAVSNSSWANFGYLVTAEIKDKETISELNILCAAHGIGLIKLDIEQVNNSQIIIPARERNSVDWAMVNRLVKENRDFNRYIEKVYDSYKLEKLREDDWKWSE